MALLACLAGLVHADPTRIATYNTELGRKGPGLLLRDIRRGDDQVKAVLQVLVQADADILALQSVDRQSLDDSGRREIVRVELRSYARSETTCSVEVSRGANQLASETRTIQPDELAAFAFELRSSSDAWTVRVRASQHDALAIDSSATVLPAAIRPLRFGVAMPDRAAERLGLTRGMPFSDARAFCPDLQSRPADPRGDQRFQHTLRRWAVRYCPWVGLEEEDGLVLDITGTAHLFGGESALLMDMRQRLSRAGMAAHIGLADSRGAAWALARHGEGAAKAGHALDALKDLPVAALRLEEFFQPVDARVLGAPAVVREARLRVQTQLRFVVVHAVVAHLHCRWIH